MPKNKLIINLRLGRKSDARKVIHIHRRAVHEIASDDYSQEILNCWGRFLSEEELNKRQKNFNVRIEKDDNIIVVAEVDKQLAGFGEILIPESELVAMYVNPDFKRQGVEAAILKDLEFRAEAKGLKYLHLHSSITAVPFYRKNGFEEMKKGTHTLDTGLQMKCVMMKKNLSLTS